MWISFTLLCLAMLCAGVGNVYLSKGMRQVGTLEQYRIGPLFTWLRRAIINSNILLGVLISTAYFFLWLMVLSFADVSWALPMNAVEYIMVAIFSILFLSEKVSPRRWLGLFFITLGGFFMMFSW